MGLLASTVNKIIIIIIIIIIINAQKLIIYYAVYDAIGRQNLNTQQDSSVDYHSVLILISQSFHLYKNGVWLADYAL